MRNGVHSVLTQAQNIPHKTLVQFDARRVTSVKLAHRWVEEG